VEGAMVETLRPAKVTDQLVEHLARSIVSGRIRPSERVPSEAELVSRFGISKVGVREAIGVLAALGLVQVQQGKRTLVRDEQDWHILSKVVQQALREELGSAHVLGQLFEVRLILEPAVAALAAERVTGDGAKELEGLVADLQRIASGTQDTREFLQKDLSFHDGVVRLVQNPSMRAMVADLYRHMLDNWDDSRVTATDLADLVDEHAAIADAIARKDPEAARAAMDRHIVRAREVEIGRRSKRPETRA